MLLQICIALMSGTMRYTTMVLCIFLATSLKLCSMMCNSPKGSGGEDGGERGGGGGGGLQ